MYSYSDFDNSDNQIKLKIYCVEVLKKSFLFSKRNNMELVDDQVPV